MEAAVGRTPPPPPTPPLPTAREDEMRAAGGWRHGVDRWYWPGMDPAVHLGSMAALAEAVVPLVPDAPGSGGAGA